MVGRRVEQGQKEGHMRREENEERRLIFRLRRGDSQQSRK
jgi:hypothetical protein